MTHNSELEGNFIPRWLCPNCGQHYFGEAPPDMCAYCRDFTTWQRLAPQDKDTSQRGRDGATPPPAKPDTG